MNYSVLNDYIIFKVQEMFIGKTLEYFFDFYKKSKKAKYLLLKNDDFLINNQRPNLQYVFQKNDNIKIKIDNEIDYKPSKESAKLVYQDEFYLVVHKPNNLIIHDDSKNKINCLNSRVAKLLIDLGQSFPIRPIHRLDLDTSGLVIYSRILFFQSYIDHLMTEKQINRFYYAVCHGKEKVMKKYRLVNYFKKDRHVNNKYFIAADGVIAITNLKVIFSTAKFSIFDVSLETGRTHQIRIHLNSIKHPIIGDKIYGIKDDQNMMLFAYKVELKNPISFESITVNDPFIDLEKMKEVKI